MGKLHSVWDFVRHHKYSVTIVFFVLLIGFAGENSWWSRHQLNEQIDALKSEKEAYIKQYNEDTRELKILEKDPSTAERIARERYLMKRSNEEVYVLLSPGTVQNNDSTNTDETAE